MVVHRGDVPVVTQFVAHGAGGISLTSSVRAVRRRSYVAVTSEGRSYRGRSVHHDPKALLSPLLSTPRQVVPYGPMDYEVSFRDLALTDLYPVRIFGSMFHCRILGASLSRLTSPVLLATRHFGSWHRFCHAVQ